ncbi:MAG TPA: hypothetical protein VNN07_04580, partial [Candidatus Tectomicrobia bacterium]|nr:hypothetical protein [Candidatus Tectomicrobia bacterium]
RARPRLVHRTWSALSGRILVIEHERQRRLVVGGEVLSAFPIDGDWTGIRREYWWHALAGLPLPRRPTALLVGLGGGTQVHLLHHVARPRLVTIVERDPVIVRVALEWFGLDALGPLEFLVGDAATIAPALARAGRRFDFVMEDAAYGDEGRVSLPLARALVPLVARGGTVVVNRHLRGDARAVAAALRPCFATVRVRRVRREGENVLVCATEPTVGNHPRGSGL